jgi:hypothetical protein
VSAQRGTPPTPGGGRRRSRRRRREGQIGVDAIVERGWQCKVAALPCPLSTPPPRTPPHAHNPSDIGQLRALVPSPRFHQPWRRAAFRARAPQLYALYATSTCSSRHDATGSAGQLARLRALGLRFAFCFFARHADEEHAPHVAIIGGGFGGLTAAKALALAPVQLTLIDRSNRRLFTRLLYRVASGGCRLATSHRPFDRSSGAQGSRPRPSAWWSTRMGVSSVEGDLSFPGHPEAFVIGHMARFDQTGVPLSRVSQTAMRRGTFVGRRIRALVRGEATGTSHRSKSRCLTGDGARDLGARVTAAIAPVPSTSRSRERDRQMLEQLQRETFTYFLARNQRARRPDRGQDGTVLAGEHRRGRARVDHLYGRRRTRLDAAGNGDGADPRGTEVLSQEPAGASSGTAGPRRAGPSHPRGMVGSARRSSSTFWRLDFRQFQVPLQTAIAIGHPPSSGTLSMASTTSMPAPCSFISSLTYGSTFEGSATSATAPPASTISRTADAPRWYNASTASKTIAGSRITRRRRGTDPPAKDLGRVFETWAAEAGRLV